MRNEFEVAFNEITEMRSLPREVVLEALETALVSAYRRDASASAAQRVEATIDPGTGRARIFVEKEVVESVENLFTEVELEKARYYEPEAQLGDMVMVQVEGTTKKFGRIAAQTAKQVILQKIREAERNSLFDEFIEREGDLVTGTVQSVSPHMVTLSLGRAEAILPRAHMIPGERYRAHEKLRTYVVEVKKSNRGPQIVVSRGHRNMLRRLLEYEVPEIYNGQVEIKSIAREAGYRSKVAVAALQDGVDPVGACVGMRGMRIQNIVKELHEEKIDVIEWNPDAQVFIEKALSPARVLGVYLEDDPDTGRTAVVIVPDDQLSLAIGREGQNARLAAKLTGWRIDIKSVSEAVTYALDNLSRPPLSDLTTSQADLVSEVMRVMEKKLANRTVMPEEYTLLGRFAKLSEEKLQGQRQAARQRRINEINAIKATLPQGAFTLPVDALGLPEEFTEALRPMENVGEIMLRFLMDETRLRNLLAELPKDALLKVQAALDKVVIPDLDAVAAAPVVEIEAAAPVAEPDVDVNALEPEELDGDDIIEPEVVPDAFGDQPVMSEATMRAATGVEADRDVTAAASKKKERVAVIAAAPEVEIFEDEEGAEVPKLGEAPKDRQDKQKKERQKRRQLVFDEETGATVAKRRRKGSRQSDDDWNDFM